MGAKIASFLATLLLSIPLAAIGLMAVFGVPQVLPAGPERDQVVRGIQNALSWRTETTSAQTNAIPAYEDAIPYGQQPGTPITDANAAVQNHSPFVSPNGGTNAPQARLGAANEGGPFGGERRIPPQDPFSSGNSSPATQPVVTASPTSMGSMGTSRSPFDSAPAHSIETRGLETRGVEASVRGPMTGEGHGSASNPFNSPMNGMHQSGMNTAAAGATLTWRQASMKLADLGITNFHLERGATEGTFLFVCLYAPGDAPQVTHRFEAESDDPLLAVNRVLQQVDGWMQNRFARSNYPTRGEGYSMMTNGQR